MEMAVVSIIESCLQLGCDQGKYTTQRHGRGRLLTGGALSLLARRLRANPIARLGDVFLLSSIASAESPAAIVIDARGAVDAPSIVGSVL